jgi:hypothetical protein
MPTTTASKQKETDVKPEVGKNSLRAFRSSQDLEHFYRFVHENGLRRETKVALDFLFSKLKQANKRTRRKKIQ